MMKTICKIYFSIIYFKLNKPIIVFIIIKYMQFYYFIILRQIELSVGCVKAAVEGAHIQINYQKAQILEFIKYSWFKIYLLKLIKTFNFYENLKVVYTSSPHSFLY